MSEMAERAERERIVAINEMLSERTARLRTQAALAAVHARRAALVTAPPGVPCGWGFAPDDCSGVGSEAVSEFDASMVTPRTEVPPDLAAPGSCAADITPHAADTEATPSAAFSEAGDRCNSATELPGAQAQLFDSAPPPAGWHSADAADGQAVAAEKAAQLPEGLWEPAEVASPSEAPRVIAGVRRADGDTNNQAATPVHGVSGAAAVPPLALPTREDSCRSSCALDAASPSSASDSPFAAVPSEDSAQSATAAWVAVSPCSSTSAGRVSCGGTETGSVCRSECAARARSASCSVSERSACSSAAEGDWAAGVAASEGARSSASASTAVERSDDVPQAAKQQPIYGHSNAAQTLSADAHEQEPRSVVEGVQCTASAARRLVDGPRSFPGAISAQQDPPVASAVTGRPKSVDNAQPGGCSGLVAARRKWLEATTSHADAPLSARAPASTGLPRPSPARLGAVAAAVERFGAGTGTDALRTHSLPSPPSVALHSLQRHTPCDTPHATGGLPSGALDCRPVEERGVSLHYATPAACGQNARAPSDEDDARPCSFQCAAGARELVTNGSSCASSPCDLQLRMPGAHLAPPNGLPPHACQPPCRSLPCCRTGCARAASGERLWRRWSCNLAQSKYRRKLPFAELMQQMLRTNKCSTPECGLTAAALSVPPLELLSAPLTDSGPGGSSAAAAAGGTDRTSASKCTTHRGPPDERGDSCWPGAATADTERSGDLSLACSDAAPQQDAVQRDSGAADVLAVRRRLALDDSGMGAVLSATAPPATSADPAAVIGVSSDSHLSAVAAPTHESDAAATLAARHPEGNPPLCFQPLSSPRHHVSQRACSPERMHFKCASAPHSAQAGWHTPPRAGAPCGDAWLQPADSLRCVTAHDSGSPPPRIRRASPLLTIDKCLPWGASAGVALLSPLEGVLKSPGLHVPAELEVAGHESKENTAVCGN